MSHKGRYDNLVVPAKGALNFLSSLNVAFSVHRDWQREPPNLSVCLVCGGKGADVLEQGVAGRVSKT
jgi:hypothetical protein